MRPAIYYDQVPAMAVHIKLFQLALKENIKSNSRIVNWVCCAVRSAPKYIAFRVIVYTLNFKSATINFSTNSPGDGSGIRNR